ncbi:acyl-CoA thioesterase [Methylobacterium organophilum]|uniref:Acyl-CoA thioesterase 2 n=1 Tax=Methylobacterium organophilum TaxID=410 RepID=A0ABQ4TES8_METOR|nr:acyl-CoA thioesterase II [Methylobacterium organophilum]UMY17477.1 acyl-CoA thioesterase II [Methylobacterium organophilum]GJE29708.1 Acyl-CoA thioesterase 2 [Methylobacterium organophilum]
MPGAISDLIALLDLEPRGTDLYRGVSPKIGWPRVFGGQVVAQALVAATRTVPESRPPHSLHAYFLLGGDPKVPIDYEVERIRDGGSFTTRRVKALQGERAIFAMSVSFHAAEEGFEHAFPIADIPGPDDLPDAREAMTGSDAILPPAVLAYFTKTWPIALRPVEVERYRDRTPRAPRFHVWLKADGPLPDDPAVHRAVLAYASDMTLLDATLIAHGRTVFDADIQSASLDHALWFHRPFRADDWLLYVQDSPSAAGGRGFARGTLYDRAGRLVASVAQEGLIRPRLAPTPAAPFTIS